ncbi:MAG: response regulator [bacterium]|nr:response regulator [bacterium]
MPNHVLLIDPDSYFSDICAAVFQKEGFEIVHCRKADDALTLVEQTKPRAVVLDLLLSEGDGFQVLEALSQEPATRGIPVFVYAATGAKEDMDRCLALGACAYLMKSHHRPDALVRLVVERLGG